MDMIHIETTEILRFEASTELRCQSMPFNFESAFMRTLKGCGWTYKDAEYEYNVMFRTESTARLHRYGSRT